MYEKVLVAIDRSENSNRALAAARELASLSDGEVRNTIVGQAAREIVADAVLYDAGVIVMGSRGRSDLTGLLLGSTAHKVIHLTDRPVLVVR